MIFLNKTLCSADYNIFRAFPDRRVRVLWLESDMNQHGQQVAKRFIRGVDPEINDMNDERRKIAVIKHHGYKQITKMTHVEKYIRDPYQWGKRAALIDILRYYRGDSVIVYFNTKESLRKNHEALINMNERDLPRPKANWYCLDGDCYNLERRHIINNFKESGGVLLTTDLMNGGGISLNVNIIINMEVPHFNAVVNYTQRCAVSTAKQVFVFTIVNGVRRSERRQHGIRPSSLDEQNMDRIKGHLKMEIASYHSFSGITHIMIMFVFEV